MSTHEKRDGMIDEVLTGLESTPLSAKDAKTILADTGFEVERELADFKERLHKRIRSRTWKAEADARIIEFDRAQGHPKWQNAPDSDINAAYDALQGTEYKMAARNFEDLTRDEKIAILEDVEFLDDEGEKGDC